MQRLAERRHRHRPTPTRPLPTTATDVARCSRASVAPVGCVLLVLGLVWLAATMWCAHASIVGNAADAAVVLGTAAAPLPVVVAASLLAGAAAGLGRGRPVRRRPRAVGRLRGRRSPAAPRAGWSPAGVILFGYGANTSVAVLALTVGVAAVLGGAAAALPPPRARRRDRGDPGGLRRRRGDQLLPVAAEGPVRRRRHDRLAGARPRACRCHAAVVCGLVAGLVAYLYLRRRGPDRRGRGTCWPGRCRAAGPARRGTHPGGRRLPARPGRRLVRRRPGGHGVPQQRPAAATR